MEGGNIDNKEEREDWGALRDTYRDWDGEAGGTWINQCDGSI